MLFANPNGACGYLTVTVTLHDVLGVQVELSLAICSALADGKPEMIVSPEPTCFATPWLIVTMLSALIDFTVVELEIAFVVVTSVTVSFGTTVGGMLAKDSVLSPAAV